MDLKSTQNVLNLPNLLTILRIILIPFVAILLAEEIGLVHADWDETFQYAPGKIAALLVIVAGITDLLDGYLARKWKIESLLGKFLDPVADKLFLTVGLVMLMQLGRVETWLVIVLLSREFLITGLRGVAAGEGIIVSASQTGKWKLTLQLIALGCLMWYGPVFGLPAGRIGNYILYVALLISLVSGYLYLHDFLVALKAKREQSH